MSRFAFYSFALLCFALLSACGNINDGRPLTKKSAASTANPVKAAVTAPLKLRYCSNFTVLNGSNSGFATIFSGSSICRVDSDYPIVQLKVGMNFPANARFCLVPANNFALPETCFVATDAMTIHLDAAAADMGSIVIVAESDLNAYKAFVNYYADYAPPRALALMNQ